MTRRAFFFRLRLLQLRRAMRRLHPRFRLFLLGLLAFLAGWYLIHAALRPTPTVQPDTAALPGFVLYLGGFVAMFWAVFAPTSTTSQEETHG